VYLGDYAAGDTIDFKFTTRRFSTGAPHQLAGTPSLQVYKSNSTTQSTSGITLTVDFDSVTGKNHVRIDTTADGAFYADGGQFDVCIAAGTVDSVSVVGEVIGRFTLRAQASLYPTTAGRKLDVSAGGEAGVDWANVGTPGSTVNLSATTLNLVNTVTTLTNLPAITANWLTAAGLATDAVTEIRDAITGGAYALSTDANGRVRIVDGTGAGELDSSSGSFSVFDFTAAAKALIQAEAEEALQTYHLDHLIHSADPGGVVANSSFLAKLVSKSATPAFSSFDNTTDSLEALRDNELTAAQVWAAGTRTLTGLGFTLGASDIGDGAIDRATFAADTGLQTVRSNTAQAGGATSITLDASASATDNFYNGQRVYLTGGTGAGQDRLVTAYNGTTKVATVDHAWATNPDATSTFAVKPDGRCDVEALSLDATAADNAEAFFDGTGYAGTNNVIPTVTTLTNLPAITANWLTAAGLATDAVQEIRDAITGGAYALATDANGRVRIVDGTGAGELDTSSGHVTLADGSLVTAKLGTFVLAKTTNITGFNDLAAAAVNAEVLDCLATDTYAEPGQGAPAATATLAAKLNYLYKWTRNKRDNDGTQNRYYADDATTIDQKQTTTSSGGTVTVGEMATGA